MVAAERQNIIKSVSGAEVPVLGTCEITLVAEEVEIAHEFLVIDSALDLVIGCDLIRELNVIVDVRDQALQILDSKHWSDELKTNLRKMVAAVSAEAATVTSDQVARASQADLQKMVDQAELSEDGKAELFKLLFEFSDCFSTDGYTEPTTVLKHAIDTGTHKPIQLRARRVGPAKEKAQRQLVLEMLDLKRIRPSNSPWAFPVVIVQKKDGGLRFCVDYRLLNEVTRADAYPMPTTEDMLTRLHGADWFSVLDLASKTAFITPFGLYEFLVLPFGLKNGPASCQRLMNTVLTGSETAVAYVDDTVVHSTGGVPSHMAALRDLLLKTRKAKLRFKPSKVKLFQRKVKVVGHIVSAEGVQSDPEYVQAVVNFPAPAEVCEGLHCSGEAVESVAGKREGFRLDRRV
eukprot:TRINITY_DN1038_c0_g1_i2.p3 TRINITY_DN1038_c0_g1~~TRINITY_DN1038_c0_g1_i2.p3  ORF type:complete len:404 (+),score=82.81 TRINITY_DN1038_c0_g1_i2:1442-2653(+)